MDHKDFAELSIKDAIDKALKNDRPVVVIYIQDPGGKCHQVGKIVSCDDNELRLNNGSSKEVKIPRNEIKWVSAYEPSLAGSSTRT